MTDLSVLPLPHRPVRRLGQLLAGLTLFSFGEALIVRAALGVVPWDVLSQGLVRHFGLTLGAWSMIVGTLVLLLWIPLRERPGIGTVANALLIGLFLDPFLRWIPEVGSDAVGLGLRAFFLVVGVALNGFSSALYVGSRHGPGPRDGLMTALVRITGRSVRLIRTSIEVTVVVAGFLMGGNLGVGTVLYALAVGPVIHACLPWFTIETPRAGEQRTPRRGSAVGRD